MATPQTLDHFLEGVGNDKSIQRLLIDAFNDPKCAPKPGTGTYPPVAISIYWSSKGEGSPREIKDAAGPLVCATPIRSGVDNILQDIRRRIAGKVGEDPIGLLRIRAFVKGDSEAYLFDRSGSIIPADTYAFADPSIGLLSSELAETRKQRDTAFNLILAAMGHLSAVVQSQATQIAQLSVARTAGTAGSDLGSIATIAGVAALVIGYPALKEALGVPRDATLADIVQAARKLALGAVSSPAGSTYGGDGRGLLGLREGALPAGVERPNAETPTAQPETPPAELADDVAAVARLLDRAKDDPAFREELLAKAFEVPAIRSDAMAAYMKAQTAGGA